MADRSNITFGFLADIELGLRSAESLYELLENSQSRKRAVRAIKLEVEALKHALRSLKDAMAGINDDLNDLRSALLQCQKICGHLSLGVGGISGRHTDFENWPEVKDIKEVLAGYRLTIVNILIYAFCRNAAVTVNVLNLYKKMIDNTISNLKETLEKLDSRLVKTVPQEANIFDIAAERKRTKDERENTQRCVTLCERILENISRIQPGTVVEVLATQKNHNFVVCTPEEFRFATENQLLVENQSTIMLTRGDLTSAKRVVAELGDRMLEKTS